MWLFFFFTQYPVPDDFFGEIAPLTQDEIDHYTKLAQSWVKGLLDASTSDEVINNIILNISNSIETKKLHLM